MSGFDLIIAVIFLLSIIVAVMRGFIREALSITSWILAIWLAKTFCVELGDYVGQYINIPAQFFRAIIGFGVIFVGTLFLFSIISYIVSKLLVRGAIKGTDRVLAIFFGIIRAAAIVVIVIIGARGIGMQNSDWWSNSNYIGYFVPTADFVEKEFLPEMLKSTSDQAAEIINPDTIDAVGTLIQSLPESSSVE